MLRCKQRAGTFYLGIMFCSELPGEGICRNPLLCIDRMSAEYGTERIYESFAEQKRDQTFMGELERQIPESTGREKDICVDII